MDLQEDTRLRSLKEQVDSGGEVRAAKRRKSKKSFSEIKAEIDAKKINKDKLLFPPSKYYKVLDKFFKIIKELKVNRIDIVGTSIFRDCRSAEY